MNLEQSVESVTVADKVGGVVFVVVLGCMLRPPFFARRCCFLHRLEMRRRFLGIFPPPLSARLLFARDVTVAARGRDQALPYLHVGVCRHLE